MSNSAKYVKGFKLNRYKIAIVAGLQSGDDPEVDVYIPTSRKTRGHHGDRNYKTKYLFQYRIQMTKKEINPIIPRGIQYL